MQPDLITHNSFIRACDKGKNPKRTLEIFDSMKHQSVHPDVITYNSLISAREKGKNPKQALKFFACMENPKQALEMITCMEHQRVQPKVMLWKNRFDTTLNSFDIKKNSQTHKKTHFLKITIFGKI